MPQLHDIAEARALRDAGALGDHELVDELMDHADLARHGFSNPDGLRWLAALSFVLARRIDRAIARQTADAG